MNTPCGCCEGIEKLTPMSVLNRPGLPALSYRVGTHASFLQTMKARLSNLFIDIPTQELDDKGQFKTTRKDPLRLLETRLAEDPAIALLDAWAVIADVLTFYQERIANEGYLRTATERRSIMELARLVGYSMRPGVASTVYLAYTLEEDQAVTPPKPTLTVIPAGARAQSVPGPGELPQSFETAEDLAANSAWNNLQVRLTRPQTRESIEANKRVYLKGTSTTLKSNDPLLIVDVGEDPKLEDLYRVTEVISDTAAQRTAVNLRPWDRDEEKGRPDDKTAAKGINRELLDWLGRQPSRHPANAARLRQDIQTTYGEKSDAGLQLLSAVKSEIAGVLPTAIGNAKVTPQESFKVYVFGVTAAPFGKNATKRMRVSQDGEVSEIGEWPILEWQGIREKTLRAHEQFDGDGNGFTLDLDASHDTILAHTSVKPSWIIVESKVRVTDEERQVFPSETPLITKVTHADAGQSRADYGVSGKITRLTLGKPWIIAKQREPDDDDLENRRAMYDRDFQVIRAAKVYVQSEEVELAEEPIEDDLCKGNKEPIELAGLYSGLKAGRWLIISGERTDVTSNGVPIPGIAVSELVMLAHSKQDASDEPGDRMHTWITLAEDLAYCYRRDTVEIWGNVAKATQGETRNEVLGSGDGTKALQQFPLRQPPLTFRPAPNPSGIESTLQVRVEDVLWHEADSLADLLPIDHKFITRTDEAGKTTVVFGTGEQGARLPTGRENVKAIYRNGIGKSGNVKAEQITLLSTRPLGVKAVTNPIRASGGADRESRDQARRNASAGVMVFDRLVSIQDYTDFTRSFAGIGKASAVSLSDGRRQLVHVTIAGSDDAPIDTSSDLYIHLVQALQKFGDPHAPLRVETRELLALVVSANINILPDYRWEFVKPKIVEAMLDKFGFERRDLGQPVFLSEVISTIQEVKGIVYVDVDVLDTVSEHELATAGLMTKKSSTAIDRPRQRLSASPARISANAHGGSDGIRPAQLIFLPSTVPAALVLNEVTG